MPETVSSWLEPVISHPVVQNIITHYFICGIITGIVLVYVFRFILWACFRKKCCANIVVKSEAGDISISAGAVSHVISHASKSLKCLDIKRVRIFTVKDGYNIDVRAVMNASTGTAPQLMEKISEIVKNQMSTVFGITNIRKVTLDIVNCGNSAPEKAPENKTENPENPEFFHSAGHGDRTISLKFHDAKPDEEKNKDSE